MVAPGASAQVQQPMQQRKPLRLVDIFDAGQLQTVILKIYDAEADVICYVLTPENASKRQINELWTYEGNSVGSISCLKNIQYVIPIQQQDGSPTAPR